MFLCSGKIGRCAHISPTYSSDFPSFRVCSLLPARDLARFAASILFAPPVFPAVHCATGSLRVSTLMRTLSFTLREAAFCFSPPLPDALFATARPVTSAAVSFLCSSAWTIVADTTVADAVAAVETVTGLLGDVTLWIVKDDWEPDRPPILNTPTRFAKRAKKRRGSARSTALPPPPRR